MIESTNFARKYELEALARPVEVCTLKTGAFSPSQLACQASCHKGCVASSDHNVLLQALPLTEPVTTSGWHDTAVLLQTVMAAQRFSLAAQALNSHARCHIRPANC
jgi:hypothetical protein